MDRFIFIESPRKLARVISDIYVAGDVVVNHGRDYTSDSALEEHGTLGLNRAAVYDDTIDDDGNVMPGLTIVMPAAFVKVIEHEHVLYWAAIDFTGVAGLVDIAEDPRDIPEIINRMLSTTTRDANVSKAFGL